MAYLLDFLTALSSTVLRVSSYLFLRWIPGHHFPPIIWTSLAIYIPAFIASFLTTSPYDVIADEVDIIVREHEGVHLDPEETELLEGSEEGPLEELDVQETVVLEEKSPRILTTLLSGLPSPTSVISSLATLVINLTLVGMVTDFIYRAPVFHPAYDLSVARVGYVSDNEARILIREPHISQLPIFVSYRYADTPIAPNSGYRPIDTSWKSAGAIRWVSEETDYTANMTIPDLMPDTRYQYAVSNNRSGYFITAPPVGQISKRNNNKFTFLHSSCILPRFPYDPFSHPLSVPGFRHLARWIPTLKAYFMLFLGDFIYVDVPRRLGTDAETYRREYRQVYASPDWPAVSEDLPWIHLWDDHEIANDWDGNTTGVYHAAVDPWMHYHVSVNPPPAKANETYFIFTQGPASFFMMDTRSYRAPANSSHPTDPTKSMLGQRQLRDLLSFLRAPEPPGVRWKIVASSIPFSKNWWFGSHDTWAGYTGERKIILEAMWDVGLAGGVGVVVLSGDRHEFAATSFPPPVGGKWPLSAAVHEFSTSPLSMFYLPTRTYRQDDDEDVCIKYLPDGNSKFGAVEISSPPASEQSLLTYRLFIEGEEAWSHTISTPPNIPGTGRAKDAIWR